MITGNSGAESIEVERKTEKTGNEQEVPCLWNGGPMQTASFQYLHTNPDLGGEVIIPEIPLLLGSLPLL